MSEKRELPIEILQAQISKIQYLLDYIIENNSDLKIPSDKELENMWQKGIQDGLTDRPANFNEKTQEVPVRSFIRTGYR